MPRDLDDLDPFQHGEAGTQVARENSPPTLVPRVRVLALLYGPKGFLILSPFQLSDLLTLKEGLCQDCANTSRNTRSGE
jgi:hypothetical protein